MKTLEKKTQWSITVYFGILSKKKKKKKIGAYFSLGERRKRDEGSTQMIKPQNKILEKWVN